MQLGEKLRVLRTQRNLTLDEVGAALGTSRQNVYRYESGIIANIPIDKIEKLARLYRVSPAYLVGWDKPADTWNPESETVEIPTPDSGSETPGEGDRSLGERIAHRRCELGISQGELAARLGVSRSTLYRYETGDIEKLPATLLSPLAKVLRTTPAVLIGWDNQSDVPNGERSIKEIFHANLRRLMAEQGRSQRELARALNVSPSAIYTYMSGANTPRMDKIDSMCKFFGISRAELLQAQPDSPDDTDTVDIPIYGSVPAGVPVEAIEDIDGTVQIPADWLRGGKQYIALRVHGDSMYPRYLDGDIVIIRLTPEFVGGKDSVVYVNGYEATLKTVHTYTPGQITLQPVNPMYPTKHYGQGDEPVTCLGHVVELRRTVK